MSNYAYAFSKILKHLPALDLNTSGISDQSEARIVRRFSEQYNEFMHWILDNSGVNNDGSPEGEELSPEDDIFSLSSEEGYSY